MYMLTPETAVNLSVLSPAATPVVETAENRTSAYVAGNAPPHALAQTDATAPDASASAIPATAVAPNTAACVAPAQPSAETEILCIGDYNIMKLLQDWDAVRLAKFVGGWSWIYDHVVTAQLKRDILNSNQ